MKQGETYRLSHHYETVLDPCYVYKVSTSRILESLIILFGKFRIILPNLK